MNEEKVNKIFCANCLEELETTDICPYCGYNPAQDDGKYPLALSHNTILNGQYIIGRVLGQGGFGITYLVKDWTTKNRMVLKEYLPNTMATRTKKDSGAEKNFVSVYSEQSENFEYGKKCFLEEAQTLAGFIGSPNIVQVHSFFEENGTAYFTMDYIEGISFQKFITDNGGKVLWQEAEKVLLPVMDALGIVHSKGFIHRDVKPDNIFITTDGIVKLLDFGAARYSLGDRTQSLDILLTHGFAPKEQYMTRSRQGPYTDVYAVAASFYYAITGIKPSNSMDRLEKDDLVAPSRLGVKIPEEVENAILKGMEVQPADRYQSMAEFKQALTMQEDSKDKGPQPSSTNADTNTVNYTASDDSKFKLKINRKALIKVGLALVAIVLIIILQNDVEPTTPPPTPPPTTTQEPTTSNKSGEEKYKPVGNTANNLANGANMARSSSEGNTMGNIINDGIAAEDEQYKYYACDDNIIRVSKDTGEIKKLKDSPGFAESLNLYNGYLYYIYGDSIYQIDIEGEKNEMVLEGTGYDQMYIADGTAYIHTRFDELVCADAKNWEVRNTLSDIYDNYTISGEWVYYQNDNDYEYDFYKIKLDGTKKERLSDSLMFSPVVKDNWVYGRSTSKIFRIATDGSSEEKIYYSSNDIYRMNAGDGRIYYTEDKNKKTSVYCMNLDGTKRTKLFTEKKGTSVSHLNILKDELVFKDFEEDGIVVINIQTGDTTIYHDNDNAVENNSADDDYIFPDSDTKKLTKKMAARLSKSSVRLAINEIYARHGRRFDDENLQKYFNEKDWYIGTIDAKDFNESVFNKIEKYNIRLLNKYR